MTTLSQHDPLVVAPTCKARARAGCLDQRRKTTLAETLIAVPLIGEEIIASWRVALVMQRVALVVQQTGGLDDFDDRLPSTS